MQQTILSHLSMRIVAIGIALMLVFAGCTTKLYTPDLGGLYNKLVQQEDPYRNPVLVIPGILGSKLRDADSGAIVWGAFGPGSANPKKPQGARLIALPMREGAPLNELRDQVHSDGALDRVRISLLGLRLQLKAYFYILSTLGAAGYRDDQLGQAGAIQYGKGHYTCFQYDYDWRRDIVESAKQLHAFIVEKRAYVQAETAKRHGIQDLDVKFDIIAHSMGGLVARYYLRYGAADLPADGSLPLLTWAGAKYVENLVMVGTPNAGSIDSLITLVEGKKVAPLLPNYQPALLGTMPSAYQLLPRGRHGVLVESADSGKRIQDLYDPDLWERMGWGLADPRQDAVLKVLLPDIGDRLTRRRIALEHQRKSLQRAKRFAAALDVRASPPAGLSLYLIAGDAVPPEAVVAVDATSGVFKVVEEAPGDGTVLRSSALMDERLGTSRLGRLESPIDWTSVQFLFKDHIGLTKDTSFTDNLLFFLFERPKET
ncbi:esterase/lipase family protein [Candidatus Entotheonella palauensis]|uniref:esterase/lipase family protein n=1 Tax=Candidatus Entotheonella palauensis TaxID=93172 RepID=UPI000B7EE1AA|nr:hypothetical protein [Candidatus Entotheonella palauensis]